ESPHRYHVQGAAPLRGRALISLSALTGAAPDRLLFFIICWYIRTVHRSAEDKEWCPRSRIQEAGAGVSLYDGANGPERGSGGRGGPGESAPYDEQGAGANERTAKASPADFRAVFDDAPAPLVVITPDDYVIVAANEAFQRATLTDCSRLLGKRIFDVFPGTVNAATVDGQRELSEGLQQIYSSRR